MIELCDREYWQVNAHSEYLALAGEITTFVPIHHIIFLEAFHLVCVRHMLPLLHLVTKCHLVSLRSDLNENAVSVFAKVYLEASN